MTGTGDPGAQERRREARREMGIMAKARRSTRAERRVRLDETVELDRKLTEALERIERARSKALVAVGTILAGTR